MYTFCMKHDIEENKNVIPKLIYSFFKKHEMDDLKTHWDTVKGFCVSLKGEKMPAKLKEAASWNSEERFEYMNRTKLADPIVRATRYYEMIEGKLSVAWHCVRNYTNLVTLDPGNSTQFIRLATELVQWLWTVHMHDIRILARPSSKLPVVTLVAASWRCTIIALRLVRVIETLRDDGGAFDGWTLLLTKRANEMSYPLAVATLAKQNIIMSDSVIGSYSVNEWDVACLTLIDSINSTGWTPGARDYFNALMARYGMLLHGDEQDIKAGRKCYNHTTLCIRAPQLATRIQPLPGLLADSFVIDMERRLFFSMRQNMSATSFYKYGHIISKSAEWRNTALEATEEFVKSVSEDLALRTIVLEKVRDSIIPRLLYPGEFEQSTYMEQASSGGIVSNQRGDPDMVLFDLRRDVYMNSQSLQNAKITDLYTMWSKLYSTDAEMLEDAMSHEESPEDIKACWWESIACRRPPYERVALLVIQKIVDISLIAAGVKDEFTLSRCGFFEDSAMDPPWDAPPRTPADAWYIFHGQAPIFVNTAHLYAIIDKNEEIEDAMDIDTPREEFVTHITPHLIDAIAIWLQCSLRNKNFTLAQLHTSLLPLVEE